MASSTSSAQTSPDDDGHQRGGGSRPRTHDSSLTPPQPKRRRVADNARVRSAKACQRCRRLKEKCDGLQPCQRCSRSGRACEFAPAGMAMSTSMLAAKTEEGVSSGRGGRLSSSSITAAAAAAAAEGCVVVNADSVRLEERTKCLERLVQHLLGDVPMDLNNLRRMAEKAGQRTPAGTWSDASSARAGTEDMDDLTLEDENFTVKTLSQSTAHYSGEFSHWNFSQKLRRRLTQCLDSSDVGSAMPPTYLPRKDPRTTTSSSSSTAMPPPPPSRAHHPWEPPALTPSRTGMRIMEYWRATQLQSPKTLVQGVLSVLPPRAVSTFLVHIYFTFAQVNNFYAEEAWLRRKLEFLYEAPGHVTSEDSAWVCSVLMVLGIGTQFAHMAAGPPGDLADDNDVREEKPTVFTADADSDVGVTFYQTASKLIPDIITIASMESVRAFLLLAHYVLPLDTQGLAYTYLGLGMKMAIQNGMHRRYTGTDLDAWTIETRNRLWWTAYTVERRVSVLHGRPASIAATEVDADLPKDLPEFRHNADVSKFSNMSALIEMTLRLGDVANAITLLRRCPKNLQHTYFERIVDTCQSLRAWWYSLPPSTRDPSPSTQTFRSNAHLKLSLLLNDIFVGRPFIFSHPTTTTSPTGSPATHESSPRPRNRTALASRAVDAAMAAISLLRTLHETTGLARSSYTEFSSCRAALLVMLAQSVGGPQTAELKGAIDVGMQLIRRMAAGNVSTQSETSVIEALETAVRRLHVIQQQQQQQQDSGCNVAARDRAGERAGEEGDDDEDGARASRCDRGAGVGDAGKSGYERFREWASLWPPGTPGFGDGHHPYANALGRVANHHEVVSSMATPPSSLAAFHSDAAAAASKTPPSFGMPPAGLPLVRVHGESPAQQPGAEHSPESARWLSMVDSGMGVGIEQLDDLGLFGGFPELGALDGWPGLN